MVNSEKLLKVLKLIDTFQNQHDLSNNIISEMNKEIKEKTSEIEKLKAVIILQESSTNKLRDKFQESLHRQVDHWVTNNYT